MRISIILAVLISTIALFPSCNIVYAQISTDSARADDLVNTVEYPGAINIGESLIHPGSPLYFLKALRERIEVLFDGTSDTKAIRQLEFSQRRLREVMSLVKAKKQDLIPETLERYKLHLKNVEDLTSQNEDLQVKVGEAVARHLDALQRAYDMVGNPRAKQAIRGALERAEEHNQALVKQLSIASQQSLIKKIAQRQAYGCKFLMREATSSGLTDTEREALKEKVARCREDIRMNLKDQLMEFLEQRQMSATPAATGR